jgi:hypothetical protein
MAGEWTNQASNHHPIRSSPTPDLSAIYWICRHHHAIRLTRGHSPAEPCRRPVVLNHLRLVEHRDGDTNR